MSHDHDRETIVVNDGGSSVGAMLLAGLLILAIVVGAWYFILGPGANASDAPGDIDVNIENPVESPLENPVESPSS